MIKASQISPYIDKLVKFKHTSYFIEKEKRIDFLKETLDKLGNPQKAYKNIHIAGTNGKGTTAIILANELQKNGKRVGLYTSPHLVDFRERLQVNNRKISLEEFKKTGKEVVRILYPYRNKHWITNFDILTLIAFTYFNEKKVDIAVIETGLGGEYDATNVITPVISVLTEISFDHREQLGNTLEQITKAKAGIIKKNVSVISIIQEKKVKNVLRKVAYQKKAPIEFIIPHCKPFHGIPAHFQKNTALSEKVLAKLGFNSKKIYRSLTKVHLPARFEIVNKNPLTVLDGAHNISSIKAFFCAIKEFSNKRIVAIFALAKDKDAKSIIDELTKNTDILILTKFKNERAMEPQELYSLIQKKKAVHMAKDLSSALSFAKRIVNKNDLLCVTGSFYLAGEYKKLIR